jgi:hypothetical protein
MINKKTILLAFVIVFLASCKKEYHCQCTNSYGTYDAGDTVEARTKHGADKACSKIPTGSDTKCSVK